MAIALLCVTGCTGIVGDRGAGAGAHADAEAEAAEAKAAAEAREAEEARVEQEARVEWPAPETRFARLTHAQWRNTIRDLFALPDDMDFSSGLRDDPSSGGFLFDNPGDVLLVDQALWGGYQRAASAIAEYVTDAARLPSLLPRDGDDSTRIDAFLRDFGLRAHRRPLTQSEIDEYRALFELAGALYEGLDDLTAGTRLVVEAVLQSPSFIYRAELSDEPDDGVIPLDGYEVASRLSYMLWNTMPDEILFTAADNGLLTIEDAREQTLRMLQDPRAAEMVVSFHNQLLETYRYGTITPAAAVFMASPDLPAHASEETERFVRDIVFGQQQGLRALLTSTETFVNAELAAIYGLQGSFDNDTWERVTLDAEQRSGIFTQVGFLATNASTFDPDPIHRGKFLAERMSCIKIMAPPVDIPPLPDPEGLTNRQLIEGHTQNPATVCATCHATIINPFGFPFESYDAVGAYRTMDRGQPVDTSSAPLIDGQQLQVANALELTAAMADSSDVHDCYVKHWIEFAHGRTAVEEDDTQRERLRQQSMGDEGDLQALIVALVETRAFLTRSLEEGP